MVSKRAGWIIFSRVFLHKVPEPYCKFGDAGQWRSPGNRLGARCLGRRQRWAAVLRWPCFDINVVPGLTAIAGVTYLCGRFRFSAVGK